MPNIDTNLYFPIVLIIAGIIMIIFGLLTYRTDKVQLYLKRCSEQTTGVLDGFDDRIAIERKQKDYYHYDNKTRLRNTYTTYTTPIVLFTALDGVQYRVTYIRPIEKRLSRGQKVNIKYNPKNPYEIVISGDKHFQVSSKMAIEFGIGFILAGIILLFKPFK